MTQGSQPLWQRRCACGGLTLCTAPASAICPSSLTPSRSGGVSDCALERCIGALPALVSLSAARVDGLDSPLIRSAVLERLNLSRCYGLTYSACAAAVTGCPRLRTLLLADCDTVASTPADSIILPPSASLTELDVTGLAHGDRTIESILSGMPRLLVLRAGCSESVRRPRLMHAALRSLDLSMTELTDAALAEMQVPKLQKLRIAAGPGLVRPRIGHPHLTYLDISSCPALLSDRPARPWLQLPKVRTVLLGGTDGLTDAEVPVALTGCPMLRFLGMRNCYRLRYPVLPAMQFLEEVDVSDCFDLHPDWLDTIDAPLLNAVYGAPQQAAAGGSDVGSNQWSLDDSQGTLGSPDWHSGGELG
eukprot:TRINITY_DN40077_c0_g1_i2.p2 TRINITY_DN40077_c0_g1~~TRINITY_DN40077_c0_g1_i2.p2  ORF type:complete len:362 (+),score=49.97 TRINITY_DN40077_c0_g1_i2:1114-2199(+)